MPKTPTITQIKDSLSLMTARQRACWRLKLKGFPLSKIAQRRGIKYQSVQNHLADGVKKVKKLLKNFHQKSL